MTEYEDGRPDGSEPDAPQPDGRQPDAPQRPAAEGVRIIGAEEVRALEDPVPEGELFAEGPSRFGNVPSRPQPPESPGVRLLAPLESDPPEEFEAPEEQAEVPELPHWSEPPTGEVPVFVPEQVDEFGEVSTQEGEDEGVDADVWAGVTGTAPRYRDHASDWAEADFIPGESLTDSETAVGALAEHVDEEEEFTEAVAIRRGGLHLGRGKKANAAAMQPERPGMLEPDQPVVQPAPSAPQGRDLPVAIATGAVFVVIALFVFNLGRGPAAWLAAIIVMVATAEVYAEARSKGYQPATLLGLIGSMSLTLGAYWKGESAYPIVIALVVAFTPLWYLSRVVHARATVNMALTLFAFGYVGVLGSFAGLLLAHPNGVGLLIGAVLCVVAHDVGAFFIGSRIGTKKIAARVSPNKTIEGLLGGSSASLLMGLVVASQISPWDVGSGLWLGVAIAITAPLGDLCQSMLKRDLGVKDIGGLLPGHGGMLDRFDSLILSLPAVYYLVRILELG